MDKNKKEILTRNKERNKTINSVEEDIILNGDMGINPFNMRDKSKKLT